MEVVKIIASDNNKDLFTYLSNAIPREGETIYKEGVEYRVRRVSHVIIGNYLLHVRLDIKEVN